MSDTPTANLEKTGAFAAPTEASIDLAPSGRETPQLQARATDKFQTRLEEALDQGRGT